jgi:hypothetical protein
MTKFYSVPEVHMRRLLASETIKTAGIATAAYAVSEKDLDRLMVSCAKKNKCKSISDKHCKCGQAASLAGKELQLVK